MDFKPHEYQKLAINHIAANKACGLFLDMGLGKTIISLTAIRWLKYKGWINKVLIIAPRKVAECTWQDEIDKWSHLKDLTYSTILGNESKRMLALEAKADVYITSRDMVVWLCDIYQGKNWPFDMVVIDELSSFKANSAKRFKALRKVRPFITRIVGLTGTPAPNTLLELWPQMFLLDGGVRLGRTLTSYRDTYFRGTKFVGPRCVGYALKAGAEQAIYKRIADICISMKAIDHLKMPERIDVVRRVKMPDEAIKQYRSFKDDLIVELADEGTIAVENALVLSNKLQQFANGRVYDEDGQVHFIHDAKTDMLAEILEEHQGNILLFYNFKSDAAAIKDRFGKIVVDYNDSKTALRDWNAGKIRLLIAHPASTAYGLNLQKGGNVIVWFGPTWSLELKQQADARLYRQGQTQAVTVITLVSTGTIDEHIMRAVENKDVGQTALLNAVRANVKIKDNEIRSK